MAEFKFSFERLKKSFFPKKMCFQNYKNILILVQVYYTQTGTLFPTEAVPKPENLSYWTQVYIYIYIFDLPVRGENFSSDK